VARLRFAVLLSTLWAGIGVAHELQPAIADFQVNDGTLTITMDLNLEAYLSGIDLDGLADTDEAEAAPNYDALRALAASELAARVPDLVAGWNAAGLVQSDRGSVELALAETQVPDVGDVALLRQSRVVLNADLAGASQVQVAWPQGAGEVVLRQQGVPDPFTTILRGGQATGPVDLDGGSAQGGLRTFWDYVPVGFDHILPKGLDHILFVVGLFFFSMAWGPLLWQVTAFTAAHTVTLALGSLGVVSIPGHIVEPLIAASIVYVAVENLFVRKMTPWRPVVVLGFGLLHGLGFASVLGEFGVPQAQFIPALLGFNVGVELGQLTVIAALALLIWISVRIAALVPVSEGVPEVTDAQVMHRALSVPVSLVVAGIGVWWVIERTLL